MAITVVALNNQRLWIGSRLYKLDDISAFKVTSGRSPQRTVNVEVILSNGRDFQEIDVDEDIIDKLANLWGVHISILSEHAMKTINRLAHEKLVSNL